MQKRGKVPGSGKKRGSKNKTTIERERQLAADVIKREAQNRAAAGLTELNPDEVAKIVSADRDGRAPLKLGKVILSEFANSLAGMAAYYQPDPMGRNRNANPALFKTYAELALYAADKAAPFESPRLSAVAIGATAITKVEVVGGMPDDFAQPTTQQALPPGTIITADDPAPAPVPVRTDA